MGKKTLCEIFVYWHGWTASMSNKVYILVICALNFQMFEALPVVATESSKAISSVPSKEESEATSNSPRNKVGHEDRSYSSPYSSCYYGCLNGHSSDDDSPLRSLSIHLNSEKSSHLSGSQQVISSSNNNNNNDNIKNAHI